MFTRQKLHWGIKDYTQFSALSTTMSFLGSAIGIIVLQKLLKRSDLFVTNVAFISAIADYLIRTVATKSWHMYMGKFIID